MLLFEGHVACRIICGLHSIVNEFEQNFLCLARGKLRESFFCFFFVVLKEELKSYQLIGNSFQGYPTSVFCKSSVRQANIA